MHAGRVVDAGGSISIELRIEFTTDGRSSRKTVCEKAGGIALAATEIENAACALCRNAGEQGRGRTVEDFGQKLLSLEIALIDGVGRATFCVFSQRVG